MKKKVLFLIPNLKHGGAEKVLVNLVNNISSEKYEVTVLTLFNEGVHRKNLKSHIRYISRLPKSFRGNSILIKLFPAKWIWKWLVKDEYDIAISYLEGPTSRILGGCTTQRTKKVAWLHIELGTPEKAAIGFRSVEEAQITYNSFDRIIAVSENVKQCFEKNIKIGTPISVLYNTNETEQILEFSKIKPDDAVFRPETNISVCSVARLISNKGFDRLLNVHKRLMDEGLKHHIYIIGTGEDKERLEAHMKKLDIADTVTFLGFRENPYQYISRCNLYVCSSRREGFSTAVTEALIVGTPVVSTNCSGAKELLGENNEYGIVVENSEEGIYQGMKQMLSDLSVLKYYARKAKERGSNFSREKTVQAVEEMLDSL